MDFVLSQNREACPRTRLASWESSDGTSFHEPSRRSLKTMIRNSNSPPPAERPAAQSLSRSRRRRNHAAAFQILCAWRISAWAAKQAPRLGMADVIGAGRLSGQQALSEF